MKGVWFSEERWWEIKRGKDRPARGKEEGALVEVDLGGG